MLRKYQQDLYNQAQKAFGQGNRRVLVVAPCGAGKSYIFLEMAKNCHGEVLILTHRQELQQQHQKLVSALGLKNVRVAMVISEYNHMKEHTAPLLLIIDEAHLSHTNTWEAVINYYNTYTVGFTATPIRLDGKPLGDVYDVLIQGVGVHWLIENHFLAPYRYFAPFTVDISEAKVSRGDFVVSDLEYIMSNRAIYGNVIDTVNTILPNKRQIIAYCVSLKHADMVCTSLVDAGIPAKVISSKMSSDAREEIMKQFRDGYFRVLCNVGIISEGVSLDTVDSCLLLRPTMSHALYWQQAMRCLRYQLGKTAVILDFVGNYTRNPMPDDNIVWELDQAPRRKSRLDNKGNFYVRVCPTCYRTFKTADTCPYCGNTYPLHSLEIKAHNEIRLTEIKKEEKQKLREEKRRLRQEVGRAKTYPELLKIANERGYNPAWAKMVWNGRKR